MHKNIVLKRGIGNELLPGRQRKELDCNEKLFFQVVKMAFNQRRKTLRNSIKQLLKGNELPEKFTNERPEQLSVDDFVELTLFIESFS